MAIITVLPQSVIRDNVISDGSCRAVIRAFGHLAMQRVNCGEHCSPVLLGY
jgi:hypothetical protein